jgi:phospholipid transport system substrate-binding protein
MDGETIMEFSLLQKRRLPIYLLALTFLVLILPQQAVAAAKLNASQAKIQQISDRMQKALKGKPSSSQVYGIVNRIIVPYVNFNMAAKRALGRTYWNKASSSQRSRFTAQFKKMLIRTYGSAFASYNSWTMKHLGTKSSGKSVAVKTRVSPSGAGAVNVIYLMYRGKVYDINISGVSLAKSHSASFQGIARSSGMEGLIKRLKAMNSK